jgi:hypothetical protein
MVENIEYKEGILEYIFYRRNTQEIFRIEYRIIQDPVTGLPMCVSVGICNELKQRKSDLFS